MIEIILTKDGSHTLRNTVLDETYHSIHGAVQESLHVFIGQGLNSKIKQGPHPLTVIEVGFGTGLNAWLAAKRSLEIPNRIGYTSLEPFPIDQSVWMKLNYAATKEDRELFGQIHCVAWNHEEVVIGKNFTLTKIRTTIQQADLPQSFYDVVLFDAFAPEKQPDMWTLDVLEKVAAYMKPGAVFVTYCAKGQVKRDLKGLGLKVETLPGPPGKREMIWAVKR